MKVKTSQPIKIPDYPKVLPFGPQLSENVFWSIYDKCMLKASENMGPIGATPWIHLADAVSRGTISPLEAFDALEMGYLPEHLKVRASAYSHIL
jgi:hypothetical protein